MTPIVLDTDVVSFLFNSDTRAQMYLPQLQDRQWFISFMTEAELEQWALSANWAEKRVEWLRLFLRRFVVVEPLLHHKPAPGGPQGHRRQFLPQGLGCPQGDHGVVALVKLAACHRSPASRPPTAPIHAS